MKESHPMRVRGLKHKRGCQRERLLRSHPMRVRGLKLVYIINPLYVVCRTPCGCVD